MENKPQVPSPWQSLCFGCCTTKSVSTEPLSEVRLTGNHFKTQSGSDFFYRFKKRVKGKRIEEHKKWYRTQQIKDFSEDKDQKRRKSEGAILKMNRWQRFEKQFPFYQTDINGFFELLEKAMKISQKHNPDILQSEIKEVTLNSLQEVWKQNKTWTDALVSDPPSKLVQFLNETCREYSPTYAGSSKKTYSVQKLRCLAILWCEDSPEEKVVEFWNMLQDSYQSKIAALDKDFKPNMELLFEISTTWVIKHE